MIYEKLQEGDYEKMESSNSVIKKKRDKMLKKKKRDAKKAAVKRELEECADETKGIATAEAPSICLNYSSSAAGDEQAFSTKERYRVLN